MDIIEKKNPFQNTRASQDEEEKTKLVGGYIPVSLAHHLRLLSIYYENPLQIIIQQVLSDWCDSIGKTKKEIIGELVGRATSEWSRRKAESKMSQKQYLEYLTEIEERLKKKKVSSDDINAILTRVENRIAQEWENEKN